jgi:hypothetical protein
MRGAMVVLVGGLGEWYSIQGGSEENELDLGDHSKLNC